MKKEERVKKEEIKSSKRKYQKQRKEKVKSQKTKYSYKKQSQLLKDYVDPDKPGSLGGVHRFAKAHNLDPTKTRRVLEKELAYTLHKPRR